MKLHCSIGMLIGTLSVGARNVPIIECDASMIARARERITAKAEPFYSYWQLAKAEAAQALIAQPKPCSSRDSLVFHGEAQAQGIAARLLAYQWRLEGDQAAGAHAVALLDAWASAHPLPGTDFDPAIRFPNSGMDVARGMLPFLATYDLLRGHPALKPEVDARIRVWFRSLVPAVKEGIRRWEENADFGGQHFQNHHVAHTLGLALFGVALEDLELIQLALDSPDNPRDFKELVAGLILMPGDEPLGGLHGKPLHAGELEDRVRTGSGSGLTYCHLSMTLLLYTAEVLSRATGQDWVNWTAAGGESLRLPFTFYSDFWRLKNARLHGGYYERDQPHIQNHAPFLGSFEVALHHWPDVPNVKALIRSINRSETPRSWLCYYGLPLLTHGCDHP